MDNIDRKELKLIHANTLHGLTHMSGEDVIVGYVGCSKPPACDWEDFKFDEDICMFKIQQLVEVNGNPPLAIGFGEWLCRPYVTISLGQRSRIPELVDSLTKCGYWVNLQNNLETLYKPGSPPFSLENSEKLSIGDEQCGFTMLLSHPITMSCFLQKWRTLHLFADLRLWKSDYGKAFCHKLRKLFPSHQVEEIDEKIPCLPSFKSWMFEYLDYPLPPNSPSKNDNSNLQNAPSDARLLTVQQPQVEPEQLHIDESPDLTCLICMDNLANTIVFPCGHVSACRTCSEQLKSTADVSKCVRCRCPITEVMWDGKE